MSQAMKGKVAIVTGGNSGIGRATALLLGDKGATVAVVARNAERGGAVVREIEQAGGKAIFISADLGSPKDIEAMVKTVLDRFGRLDIAVNNAAAPPSEIGPLVPTADITLEHWNRLMDVNLRGVWLGMKYQIPAMIAAGGGSIVNVSSIAGGRAMAGMGHYGAAKFAMNGLTRIAAAEYATAKVRINAVMPGPVDSPIVNEMEALRPGTKAGFTSIVPMGRMGLDSEIAEAITWLCSDAATYVTGVLLPVDGGVLA